MATRAMSMTPFGDVAYLQHQLDRLAQEAFGMRSQTNVTTLPVDVYEKDDQLIVQAFVPGLRAEQLDIQVEDGVVSISGQFPQLYDSEESGGFTWYARELRGGPFRRSITLPYAVDWDSASASVADGVLWLHLPKAAEAKPRRIEIREGGHIEGGHPPPVECDRHRDGLSRVTATDTGAVPSGPGVWLSRPRPTRRRTTRQSPPVATGTC